MNKLMAFLLFIFITGTVLSFASEGIFALVTTVLVADVTESDTTIPAGTITGFIDNHFIILENEIIGYTGRTTTCPAPFTASPTCFTDVTRGDQETKAVPHLANTRLYNQTTGLINQMVGFNIVEQISTVGVFRTVFALSGALANSLAKILLWDFSYLEGQFVIFKYIILYPISVGVVWTILILFSQILTSIIRR